MFLYVIEKIPSEEIQSILHESVIKMDFFGSLGGDISEYKIHGIQGFFKTYFVCISMIIQSTGICYIKRF